VSPAASAPGLTPLAGSGGRAWLAFAACGAIWGSTFLAISLGNDALAPVWAAALRLGLAALLLLAWGKARGQTLPRGPALRAALVYGICQFGIQLPLLYWGEKRVPSGLSAVFFATIPLSSALLTRALGMERLTPSKLGGAVIAVAGVTLLFASALRGHISPVGMSAVLVSATVAGIGSIVLKRGPRQSPIGVNTVGCAIGAGMAFLESLALGEAHRWPTNWASIGPILYLTLAGSLGAFVIMSWLINRWPVSRTSYVSVIVPVIALILGNVVRGERLTWTILAGTILVLVALVMGMRAPRGPRQH
jgi:drug/metabolite transporter (DMT)-like permease